MDFIREKNLKHIVFWGHMPVRKERFSGTRAGELVRKVEYQLKKILFDAHPEYKQDPSVNVVLSYTVYGGYYAFFENRQYGDATVVDIISQISSEAMNLL